MKTLRTSLFTFILVVFFTNAYTQEIEHRGGEGTQEHENFEKYHKEKEEAKHYVTFMLGHAHISTAVKDGKDNEWLTIPSLGLYYTYRFNEKWGVGIETEMLLEVFEVAGSNGGHDGGELEIESIKRERPVSVALMGFYELHHHLILAFGAGGEFTREDSFALIRLGVDIPIIEKYGWEVFGTFKYDINIDAYNSFNLGIGISKLF